MSFNYPFFSSPLEYFTDNAKPSGLRLFISSIHKIHNPSINRSCPTSIVGRPISKIIRFPGLLFSSTSRNADPMQCACPSCLFQPLLDQAQPVQPRSSIRLIQHSPCADRSSLSYCTAPFTIAPCVCLAVALIGSRHLFCTDTTPEIKTTSLPAMSMAKNKQKTDALIKLNRNFCHLRFTFLGFSCRKGFTVYLLISVAGPFLAGFPNSHCNSRPKFSLTRSSFLRPTSSQQLASNVRHLCHNEEENKRRLAKC